ncbi:MAG: monovalent cation/H(+) antiporter subunit G [Solirubrobacteraceae bacterium]
MSLREIVAAALLVSGVALEVGCCLGVLVMRDPYDRLHYVAASAAGASLVAAAVTVAESFSLIADKALLAAGFVLLTGPVLVHATARAARVREHGEWRIPPDGQQGDG